MSAVRKNKTKMKNKSRATGYSVAPVSPQRLSIPCDHTPSPGDGAEEKGEDDEGENVIPILDDESHVAGSCPQPLSTAVCGRCSEARRG